MIIADQHSIMIELRHKPSALRASWEWFVAQDSMLMIVGLVVFGAANSKWPMND